MTKSRTRPKGAPRVPPGPPRGSQGHPRAPKRGPAAPQGSPSTPQGRPKGAQGLPTLGFTPLLKSTFFSRWGSRKKMVARDRHQNDRTDVPRLFRQVQKIWNFTNSHEFCANMARTGSPCLDTGPYSPSLKRIPPMKRFQTSFLQKPYIKSSKMRNIVVPRFPRKIENYI